MSHGLTHEGNELEIARAVVSALSFDQERGSREFHVNALRVAYEQFADDSQYRRGLSAMKLLGEIADLGRGFWLATPVRSIRLDEYALIIAPIPTRRLNAEISGARAAGLARVIPRTCDPSIPQQSIESWMRVPRQTPSSVIERALQYHDSRFKQGIQCESHEFFCVKSIGRRAQSPASFAWTRDRNRALPLHGRTRLARQRISENAYRYFLSKEQRSQEYWEAELHESPLRLQYAIAVASGAPIEYSLRFRGDDLAAIGLGTPLPSSEFKLFRALSHEVHGTNGVREFMIEPDFLSSVEPWLKSLGCERMSTYEA